MDKLCHLADDTLVTLYVEGCCEAFDVLLDRHKDRLYNYIEYQLADNNRLADDVFQETFVKVIVTIKEGRYTMQNHFFPWLTRIAHNIIIDQFRADAQLPIVTNELEGMDFSGNPDVLDSGREAALTNEQTLEDIKRLVAHLPLQQREVVEMRYYQNLSFKEIAEATGVSINTSLGRMRYALMNMRKMADEHGISLEMI